MGCPISEIVEKVRPKVGGKNWTTKSGRQWRKSALQPTPNNNIQKRVKTSNQQLGYPNSKKMPKDSN